MGSFLQKVIPFSEITSVKRAKTAGIFPNAIEIICGGRKVVVLSMHISSMCLFMCSAIISSILLYLLIWQFFFASFLSRDEAFKLIDDGWVQHGNGAKEITEQQVYALNVD